MQQFDGPDSQLVPAEPPVNGRELTFRQGFFYSLGAVASGVYNGFNLAVLSIYLSGRGRRARGGRFSVPMEDADTARTLSGRDKSYGVDDMIVTEVRRHRTSQPSQIMTDVDGCNVQTGMAHR
jgi:hypothetical protein